MMIINNRYGVDDDPEEKLLNMNDEILFLRKNLTKLKL